MALTLRRAEARGDADFGWLQSKHSFSFGQYFDPSHLGFGPLRVINEDRVAPGAGFDTHPHANMEILSYVVSGALAHADSTGERSVIRPGDVQRMTAGTGVRHSEWNASETDPVHFLQIWILPEKDGLTPSYQEIHVPEAETRGGLRLIGSRDGRDGSVTIHNDVDLFVSRLAAGETATHQLAPGRGAWVQVVKGSGDVNGTAIAAGDGVALHNAETLALSAESELEALVFDMAL